MFITGIGTATPPRRFLQAECWQAAQGQPAFKRLSGRSQALVRKILLGDNGIETRALALQSIDEIFEISPDVLHQRFLSHAPSWAAESARGALTHCPAESIEGLVISTCTGYLCPGLSSYVIELLGLRSDILALDLVGQGCGAALPNLRAAESLIASHRCQKVLSICVEVCSAAFYLDDDPGVLVSACLFGDAAGAVLLSYEPSPQMRRIEWMTADSLIKPMLRDALRFEQRHGLLRNILTPEVPRLAADAAFEVRDRLLRSAGLSPKDITAWLWHAGGRNVMTAIGDKLALPNEAFVWSAQVLRELGNISSPFVIHVLDRALTGGASDGLWYMSSFGAGFSCHGAVLRVGPQPAGI